MCPFNRTVIRQNSACKVQHATEYRLTTYDSDIATKLDEKLATKEFMRWQLSP